MRTEYLQLKNLGYTTSEIEEFEKNWAQGIHDFLAENIDNVCENMRFFLNDVDKGLILKYAVVYPESFSMNPTLFSEYVNRLKKQTDEWCEIIEKQFWSYEGYDILVESGTWDKFLNKPFLEIISSEDEAGIQKSLESMINPSTRQYEFIRLLKNEADFEVVTDDLHEDDLYQLEIGKHELIDNVKLLIQDGLNKEAIDQILWINAWILTESRLWLVEKFREIFGEEYIEYINTCFDEENIDEFNKKIVEI